MVIGIGCDIVNHDLTTDLNWESKKDLLKRIFSDDEIEFYKIHKSKNFIAGRFAAKEAVLKCLGTGMQDGISLRDVQVLQLESGKPIVDLTGEAKNISDKMGVKVWHISITHSINCSYAFAVAES